LHQPLDNLLAEEELKELGFGDVGGQFDVIEAALAKLIDHPWFVVFEYDEIHRSAPGGMRPLHRRAHTQFAELGFTLLDARSLQHIDELEQLPLPAHQIGTGLTTAPIVASHRLQRAELLGFGRDVPRPSLAAIGEDGALVELTAAAAAVWFAALSPQGVERAREEWCSPEALFEQLRQSLLGLEELRAERAELLVHELGTLPICRSLSLYTYR
jgi:hypothetical protein